MQPNSRNPKRTSTLGNSIGIRQRANKSTYYTPCVMHSKNGISAASGRYAHVKRMGYIPSGAHAGSSRYTSYRIPSPGNRDIPAAGRIYTVKTRVYVSTRGAHCAFICIGGSCFICIGRYFNFKSKRDRGPRGFTRARIYFINAG